MKIKITPKEQVEVESLFKNFILGTPKNLKQHLNKIIFCNLNRKGQHLYQAYIVMYGEKEKDYVAAPLNCEDNNKNSRTLLFTLDSLNHEDIIYFVEN